MGQCWGRVDGGTMLGQGCGWGNVGAGLMVGQC